MSGDFYSQPGWEWRETPGWRRVDHHAAKVRMKEVSCRRIRPCAPQLDMRRVLEACENWDPRWESDGGIRLHDDGLMQFTLADFDSHNRFYAALVLGKTSLRCQLSDQEPEDLLAERLMHEERLPRQSVAIRLRLRPKGGAQDSGDTSFAIEEADDDEPIPAKLQEAHHDREVTRGEFVVEPSVSSLSERHRQAFAILRDVLAKRGFRFPQ